MITWANDSRSLTPVRVQRKSKWTRRRPLERRQLVDAGGFDYRQTVKRWNGAMPVLISQRAHTIELSKDNAYERAKKF